MPQLRLGMKSTSRERAGRSAPERVNLMEKVCGIREMGEGVGLSQVLEKRGNYVGKAGVGEVCCAVIWLWGFKSVRILFRSV